MRANNYTQAESSVRYLEDFEHNSCFGRNFVVTKFPMYDFKELTDLAMAEQTYVVFSYQTPVIIVGKESGKVYRTPHRYSATTTRQVNRFVRVLEREGCDVLAGSAK